MSKNKRKSGSENAVEKNDDRTKSNRGKGLKTGLATLGVCASAFGAYYSPHFRTASSDWLERGRAFFAKRLPFDFWAEENAATADEKMREKLAQAPSFRDFLTEEYGEDGARELLGIDATTADASTFRSAPELEPKTTFADYVAAESVSSETTESQGVAVGDNASSFPSAPELESKTTFADYVAAESASSETTESQGVAVSDGASSFPTAPELESKATFADYVAAESASSETSELQGVAVDVGASSFRSAPELEPKATFADYVAAESASSETSELQGVAVDVAASSFRSAPELEPKTTFADYVAESDGADSEKNGAAATSEKTRLASENESVAATVSSEDEATLAARLQAEMKERGVGNPRIERWGGRFWRASGFATTNEGVATFCEAVDVDPTAAQQAALAKFDAAKF